MGESTQARLAARMGEGEVRTARREDAVRQVENPALLVLWRTERLTWGLLVVLLMIVLIVGTYAILPLFLRPRASYIDTLVIYASDAGGQTPIEWIVRLAIGGEVVEARCMSEREAVRIKDATR